MLIFELSNSFNKMSYHDIEAVIDAFNNPNLTREKGIYYNEMLYTCLRSDEDSIYAKDKDVTIILLL